MRRETLTATAAALVSLTVFIFLGAVSFEAATSLGTINQQGMLRSLLDGIDTADSEARSASVPSGERRLLPSDAFSAFVVDDEGQAVFLDTESPSTALLALVDHIRDHPFLEAHQMSFDADGTSFVWISAEDGRPEGRLFLAYENRDDMLLKRVKLYVVPAIIAALVVVWVSVWSGLIAKRAILAHEKQRELELEVIRQEEASRVKSAFLANMNHELRTPLNAIIGFSQMLQLQILGPIGHAKYREYIDDIIGASAHLRKLIGNILDISKIEAGEETLDEEVFSVNEMLSECLSMTSKEIEAKDQRVGVFVDDDLPDLFADRHKLRQILLNLLTNANKFTPEGGSITVAASALPDGGLEITVIDSGKGIPVEDLELVLHPFKRSEDRADKTKDGFGLGLPLSSALAALHGAVFHLESEVGAGTLARVVFPQERLRPAAAGLANGLANGPANEVETPPPPLRAEPASQSD